MDGCSGPVNTFIVEPFVPHDAEYYLCVQSKRLGDDVSFSDAGGVEIEANWDRVQTVRRGRWCPKLHPCSDPMHCLLLNLKQPSG